MVQRGHVQFTFGEEDAVLGRPPERGLGPVINHRPDPIPGQSLWPAIFDSKPLSVIVVIISSFESDSIAGLMTRVDSSELA
jgi:hypothetical protein